MKLYRRRYYNKFQQKNPFSLLEKFSCFWLIKKLKVRVFKKTRRRTNFKKRKIGNYRNFAVSANRRSNNKRRRSGVLVIKSGKWCLKIKKRDGRVIFRPLKLSDFLSANSGWRTRTTSSKFRIQKSNKPSKALRGLLRTRSEYDTYLLRKRKLYSYYLRIFKFMRWKFAHYRSIFKKYSISLYKYKGFTSLPEQFSWYYFSSNLAQAKASNIQAKFKDVIKYGLISNSRRIWKLNQFVFVNNTVPTSFYMKYINWQSNFQNRPMVYNWSKKYRIMFTNTSMSRIIPSVVYYSPGVYYKNTFILSRYNLRFNNLLSNYQHYFIR